MEGCTGSMPLYGGGVSYVVVGLLVPVIAHATIGTDGLAGMYGCVGVVRLYGRGVNIVGRILIHVYVTRHYRQSLEVA